MALKWLAYNKNIKGILLAVELMHLGHRKPLVDAIYNSHLVHIVGGLCISSGMNSTVNDRVTTLFPTLY